MLNASSGILTLVSCLSYCSLCSYSTAKAMASAAFQPHPKFGVYFNIDGWALTNLTTGFGPVSNMGDALAQVSLLPLFRWIAIFVQNDFWRIIRSHANDAAPAKSKGDWLGQESFDGVVPSNASSSSSRNGTKTSNDPPVNSMPNPAEGVDSADSSPSSNHKLNNGTDITYGSTDIE